MIASFMCPHKAINLRNLVPATQIPTRSPCFADCTGLWNICMLLTYVEQ